MEVFKDYAYYYNAFYTDKDYSSEAAQIDSLIKRYSECGTNDIITFGCGTGKHDTELVKLGYNVTGIDVSEDMVNVAKRNAKQQGMNIKYFVSDIRDYEPQEEYDVVVSLFHVISYQITNEDVLRAFKSARKSLKRGGIFIFDLWYGPGVLSDKPSVRIKDVEKEDNRLIRHARPVMYDKENRVDVHYEVLIIDKKSAETKILNEVHNMRYFFRPELELMLGLSGFELIDNLDCSSLGETDYNSWTSYFIAKVK